MLNFPQNRLFFVLGVTFHKNIPGITMRIRAPIRTDPQVEIAFGNPRDCKPYLQMAF